MIKKITINFYTSIFMTLIILFASNHANAYAAKTKTYTITFTDGEKILSEYEIKAGKSPDEIPETDSSGNPVRLWISDGITVDNPKDEVINKDTVFAVWKMPVSKSDEHIPYINGYNGRFRADDFLTRAEFCSIYTSLYDVYDNGFENDFEDIQNDTWYEKSANDMIRAGMIKGYPDNTFRPDDALTRAELIAIVSGVYNIDDAKSSFKDASGHWAESEIEFAYTMGWISGDTNGCFRPDDNISRAEAVVIINRVLERDALKNIEIFEDENICPFYDIKSDAWYYSDVMEATHRHSFEKADNEEIWTDFEYKASEFMPGIANIDGKGYLIDKNGQFSLFAPSEFVQYDGKTYYTNSDGTLNLTIYGICEINGALYFFNYDSSLLINGNYGYLYFGHDGKYTSGNYELDMLVDDALSKCTDNAMSQSDKLYASYLYLRDNCKYLSRAHHPRGSVAFSEESALFMFKNMRGNCYCFASCFLYMARRLGYSDAYVVSGGVGYNNSDHAWVMINSRIFDPELEYAYMYRYAQKKNYNLYNMDINSTPFVYYFPY